MYQVALDYDNVAGLTDIVIQPRTRGLHDAIRHVAGNGSIIPDGGYTTVLEYGLFVGSDFSVWLSVLTQFGLHTGLRSRKITITLPDNLTRAFGNYNAIIAMPDFPSDALFDRRRVVDINFSLTQIWPVIE